MTRPPIGARVRVRGTTGIPNVAGRIGWVVGHHTDGVAMVVELLPGIHPQQLTCEPSDVDIVPDCQPARLNGSAQ